MKRVIIETEEDGTQVAWGPFESEEMADAWVEARREYDGIDSAHFFVTTLGEP